MAVVSFFCWEGGGSIWPRCHSMKTLVISFPGSLSLIAIPFQSLVVEPQRQGMQRKELDSRLTVTQCCLYHFLSDLACLIPSSSSAWISITAPDTSFSNDFKPSLKTQKNRKTIKRCQHCPTYIENEFISPISRFIYRS